LINVARRNKYVCITYREFHKEICDREGVDCIKIKGRIKTLQFKKTLRKINPDVVILRHDSYTGEAYWLANRCRAVLVQDAFVVYDIEEFKKFFLRQKDKNLVEKIARPLLKMMHLSFSNLYWKGLPYEVPSKSLFVAIFSRFYFGQRHNNIGTYSKKVCCCYEGAKQMYKVMHGVDEKKIEITGTPMLDNIYEFRREMESRNKETKRDVLFISRPWNLFTGAENYYDLLYDRLSEISVNYSVAVKLHPRERKEDYYCFANQANIEVIWHGLSYTVEDNLRHILESKYIMGLSSSVIDMAILVGKPVIIYNIINVSWSAKYKINGLRFFCDSFEECMRAIKDCEEQNEKYHLHMEAQNRIKNKVVIDGKVHERIDNVVKNIMNRRF